MRQLAVLVIYILALKTFSDPFQRSFIWRRIKRNIVCSERGHCLSISYCHLKKNGFVLGTQMRQNPRRNTGESVGELGCHHASGV